MLSESTAAVAVDAMANAIIKAVEHRGRHAEYTLQELHAVYGGPRLYYAGRVLRNHHKDLVMKILQLSFKWSDGQIFEATESIDLDAMVYVPRDGTRPAYIKIQAWPPTKVTVE